MRARVFSFLGVVFSILPPLFATAEYFPLWIERGGTAALSGIAFVLLLLSIYPLTRILRRRWRSPSMPLFWGGIWLLLTVLRRIIDGVIAVAFFGLLGNLCGMLFFHLAKNLEGKDKSERA